MNILLQCVHEFVLEESGDKPSTLSLSLSFCNTSLQNLPAETFPLILVIHSFKSPLKIEFQAAARFCLK